MIKDAPDPGNGFTIREYLGGGYWKQAYRATSAFSTADVALLYFHDETRTDVVAKDVLNLLRSTAKHEFLSRSLSWRSARTGWSPVHHRGTFGTTIGSDDAAQ
jgi:hypothetical protein